MTSALLLTWPRLHLPPVHSPPAHPVLYLAGGREAEGLLHRINTAMLHRQVKLDSTTASEEMKDAQDDLLPTLQTSFLVLLLLLVTSVLLSVCELVVFCWHKAGRQTVWSVLRVEIRSICARGQAGKDQGDKQDSKQHLVKEDQEEDGSDKTLMPQEDSQGEHAEI